MTNPDREELVKLADDLSAWGVPDTRALLAKAASALRRLASSDGGVKVRELEWGPYPNPVLACDDVAVADIAVFGGHKYQVQRDPNAAGYIAFLAPQFGSLFWESKNHDTLDAAKAAAQADYEARIKSALVEGPAVKGEPEPGAWPANLNPRTLDLVQRFALALAKKLRLAEEKYGHTDGWLRDDWEAECRDHLYQHLEKGDPRDVAAYCAFMWHHGWITYRPEIAAPPADAGMREAYSALCLPRESQASDNLEGALYDIERLSAQGKPTDHVCIRTLKRVLKQLVTAEDALTAPGATTKSDGGEVITAEQMDAIETAAIAGQPLSNYGEYTPVTVRGSTSDHSSTRSDVTVEELATVLRGRGVINPNADARALLDQFEIRRK